MASSSEELSSQAESLKMLVSFFKTEENNINHGSKPKISAYQYKTKKKPISVNKPNIKIDLVNDDLENGFERY